MDRDQWTWQSRPSNDSEVNAMMSSLDLHLAICNLQPFQRGLNAARLVSMRLGLSGHTLIPSPVQRGHPFGPTDILGRVHDWYRDNYGNRMHMPLTARSIAFDMRGTLWRMRFPVVYGTVNFFIDRNLSNDGVRLGVRQAASGNILSLIDHFTQSYASHLDSHDAELIGQALERGYPAIEAIHSFKNHIYFDKARLDYEHSIDALMAGFAWGKARWETAQCAEKVLKGLLLMAGYKPRTSRNEGHNIPIQGQDVTEKLGISLPLQELAVIDCPTGMRYEDDATKDEAMASHQALLRMLAALVSPSTG